MADLDVSEDTLPSLSSVLRSGASGLDSDVSGLSGSLAARRQRPRSPASGASRGRPGRHHLMSRRTDPWNPWARGHYTAAPCARVWVTGLRPDDILSAVQNLLPGLGYATARDQIDPVLRAQGSPWRALSGERGGHGPVADIARQALTDGLLFLVADAPGIRGLLTHHRFALVVRESVPATCETLLLLNSVAVSSVNLRPFAAKALARILADLTNRGAAVADIIAVNNQDLPGDCPVSARTFAALQEEARRLRRSTAPWASWRWPGRGRG